MKSTPTESASTGEEITNKGTQLHIRQGAKALISTIERVLLVKEQHADGSSFWTFPGGGAESGESLFDGLTRELFEELRCWSLINEAVTTVWYAHSSRQNTFSIYTVFDCALLSAPKPNRKEGILEYQWVSPTNLPSSTLPQVRYILHERTHRWILQDGTSRPTSVSRF